MLSTGDAFHTIDFTANDTTLIVGENGSGKSTLLDAICFGLFGRPFRKINKPQLVNSVNEKNLVVEITFRIGKTKYMIRRGVKPNIFEIEKNGKMIDQSSKVKDYQRFLEETILKFNFKSFTQIVILGSSSFIPFMQLSALDRRGIVEDLLGIEIFSIMNILAKEGASILETQYHDAELKSTMSHEKIELTEKHIEDLEKNNAAQIEKLSKDISESKTEIERLNGINYDFSREIAMLQKGIQDEAKVESDIENLKTYETKITTKLKTARKSWKFYENHTECPTCEQEIVPEFRSEKLRTTGGEVGVLESGQGALKSKMKELSERWEFIVERQGMITACNTRVSTNNGVISSTVTFIEKTLEEIASLQSKTVGNTENIKSLRDDLKSLEVEKKNLIEERHYNTVVLNLLKDSGIKAMIVKQYLPVMNNLINKYLADMDFFVQFELDDQFNETIKSRFRDVFSYANFSEGEKQRIDIALLLTWRSIAKMRNSTNTNLLIFDEVFDASLDAGGCDELVKMLQSISGNVNIFVISHKTDALLDKFTKVIQFQKKGNFSVMVNVV